MLLSNVTTMTDLDSTVGRPHTPDIPPRRPTLMLRQIFVKSNFRGPALLHVAPLLPCVKATPSCLLAMLPLPAALPRIWRRSVCCVTSCVNLKLDTSSDRRLICPVAREIATPDTPGPVACQDYESVFIRLPRRKKAPIWEPVNRVLWLSLQ